MSMIDSKTVQSKRIYKPGAQQQSTRGDDLWVFAFSVVCSPGCSERLRLRPRGLAGISPAWTSQGVQQRKTPLVLWFFNWREFDAANTN